MERKARREVHRMALADVVQELENRMALVRRMEVADYVKVRHTGPEELVAGTGYGMVRRKVVVAGADTLDFPVAVDILDSVEADNLAAAAVAEDILAVVEADTLAVAAGEDKLGYAVGEGSSDYVAGIDLGVGSPAAGQARRNPVEADNLAEDTGLAAAVDILLQDIST
ncbi:MAG: hypothetical protein Q9195_002186 [Heterodermia aff. obscurata]